MTEYERDPRPDLWQDHLEWAALLGVAKTEGEDIWGVLHGLRCGGARLEADKEFGLAIKPGAWPVLDYAAMKREGLAPRAEQVKRLLRQAAEKIAGIAASARPASLREAVAARIKTAEGRLLAAGWSRDEVWREGDFKASDGHMTESVYQALLNEPCREVGEIAEDWVEFRWGSMGREVVQRLYRRTPELAAGKAAKERVPASLARLMEEPGTEGTAGAQAQASGEVPKEKEAGTA